MPLSPDDRAAFLELLPALGDDVDPTPILRFARSHRHSLLDELAQSPGVARIRAGVLRLLPSLVPEESAREDLLRNAASALMAPPIDHPMDRLARHPAWIGLGVLELATLQAWDEDPVGRATELAARAFEAAGAGSEVGEGEVIWAMAEEAAEVGWSTRAHALMERALDASFTSPERQADATLVAGLSRLQRGEDGESVLSELPGRSDASARTRTHAAWVLAQCALERGDDATARTYLEAAARTVDRIEDPEVADRIVDALNRLPAV